MNLCEELIEIFAKSMRKVFEKENSIDSYMKQTILGCRWRAFWGIFVAVTGSFKSMYKVLAYAIAKHRCEKHGDNKRGTMKALAKKMSSSELQASSRAFWSQ